MASIKKLKKTIQFVSSEILTDIYFRTLIVKSEDTKKIESISEELMNVCNSFISRASHPDGKHNKKIVKNYYRQLFKDWQIAIKKIQVDIESI